MGNRGSNAFVFGSGLQRTPLSVRGYGQLGCSRRASAGMETCRCPSHLEMELSNDMRERPDVDSEAGWRTHAGVNMKTWSGDTRRVTS
jgi:hypothetical protein